MTPVRLPRGTERVEPPDTDQTSCRRQSPRDLLALVWDQTAPELARVVAAVVLAAVLLAVLGPWLARRSKQVSRASLDKATAGQPAAPQPKPTAPVPAPRDDPSLDAILASETLPLRLAASIEILASQPGLEEFKNSAQRYLVTTYPGTAAAQCAAAPAEGALTSMYPAHSVCRWQAAHGVWAAKNSAPNQGIQVWTIVAIFVPITLDGLNREAVKFHSPGQAQRRPGLVVGEEL